MTIKTKKSLFEIITDSTPIILTPNESKTMLGSDANHKNISIYVCVGGHVKLNEQELIIRGKTFNLHLQDKGRYSKVIIQKHDDIYPFLSTIIDDIVPKYIDNEYLFKSWFSNGDGFERFIYSIYNTAFNVVGIDMCHLKGSKALSDVIQYKPMRRKDRFN